MVVRRIPHGSPAYAAALRLRHALLRAPLGRDLFAEDLSAETGHTHIGLFHSEAVAGEPLDEDADLIGIAVAVPQPTAPDGERVAKVRQVAVRADQQRGGLGRILMDGVEALLRTDGYGRIVLNARQTVVGFYDRLGYDRVGGIFEEVGIPHQRMTKAL